MERHLAAILAADIVGYTALMGRDEVGTLARITALRVEVLEPLITAYRGRTFKLMGDGMLVEFTSVVDAIGCAQAWQEATLRHEAGGDADQRLWFRIGINLGDVMVEGDDVLGDGVNIASRLEGLAEPGGICLSEDCYRHARGKIDVRFEDIGEQKLRNVADPVRVYSVAVGRSAATAPSLAVEPLPPAEKPSIAVLPFENMSGDPEQEYFADGISEDITTDLSKISGLFVIARNSAFAYKAKNPDVRIISRELGVRYVLEGSVRKAGSQVRINAQMIDGSTGGHIWAERYDRMVEDIFAVQDEVTRAIISALTVELGDEERVRREARRKVNPEAYDCFLRARQCLNSMNAASLSESRSLLNRAIGLDPGLAASYAILSIVHVTEHLNNWNDPSPDHLERALSFARLACETDSNEPRSYYALAHSQMWLRNLDDAERAAQRALELDPNFAGGFAALGLIRDYNGRHADAVGLFEQALKLDPQYGMAIQYLGRAQFALEHYEEAEKTFTRRLIHAPHSDMTRAYLASIYGHTGRVEDARRLWQEMMEINPDFSVDRIRKTLPYSETSWFDRYVDGLSKAGLLE